MRPAPPGPLALALATARLVPALLAGPGCAPDPASEPGPRPTVLLVSLDTTRADHLTPYGYGRDTTPFLARLAARSRVFEVGVPTATWTLPSHVSLFSGLDPAEHGCWVRLDDVPRTGSLPAVPPGLPLLTTRLGEAGYHRLAAVGGAFTSARYGLLRDFEAYLDPGDAWELPGSELNRWLFERLDERPRDRPLFLFVNYFDAHAPYAPPAGDYPFPAGLDRPLPPIPPLEGLPADRVDEALLRDALDQYDRELLVQDRELERLFDRLEAEGLLEDALVVVVGDHGEMFGEQPGTFGHGCLPYEPVARVPLLVHRTGGPVDRIPAPVSLANVPATILDELALAPLPPGGVRRFSLLDLPAEPPPAYVEHRGLERWVGVLRDARYKYGAVLDGEGRPRPEEGELLFDLWGEGEARPLGTGGELAEQRRAALRELVASWVDPPAEGASAELTDTEVERLNALGYGGGD